MIPNYIYPDRNIDNVSDMMYPKELELRADKLDIPSLNRSNR